MKFSTAVLGVAILATSALGKDWPFQYTCKNIGYAYSGGPELKYVAADCLKSDGSFSASRYYLGEGVGVSNGYLRCQKG